MGRNIKRECVDQRTFFFFGIRLICYLFKVIKFYSESCFLLFCHQNVGK